MRPLKAKGAKLSARRSGHGYGIECGTGSILSNLRFADDVLLIAQSRQDIQKMLQDFANQVLKMGLKIHLGKTKVLANVFAGESLRAIRVNGVTIQVASIMDYEKYLGKCLCLGEFHATEVEQRLRCGWAAFMKFRKELTGKLVGINLKIRLFQAVVTSTVLYGSCSWTLTAELAKKLTTTRRRMLRLMFGFKWIPTGENEVEAYVSWIKQATHKAEKLMERAGAEDWVLAHRRRKFIFAGCTVRRADKRWNQQLLYWSPPSCRGRRVGRPALRWDDDLVELAGSDWHEAAQDEPFWNALVEGYVGKL